MPTKLSRFCDGVMEAVWLAALIVVPVFFNVYSSRIFEPDKIALLRSLALLTLAAWIVKLVEGGLRPRGGESDRTSNLRAILRVPLAPPVLALAGVYLISTLFSVSPGVSFWGSYQRLQGTYTTFSYLVFFAAILGNLRRREQVERLISTAIIASLPVGFYGVLQRYQIDPVPWGGDANVAARVASNLGNSIFVAAYLILAFPLTAVRVVEVLEAIVASKDGLMRHFWRAAAYIFIAAFQVIALLFSGSRGPLLGWLASLFVLVIVLSLLWRKRWVTVGAVTSALLLGGFLVVFNIPQGPLEALRSVPGIGRLGHLLDEQSTTGRVRTLIWQGAAELVLPHEPLEYPDGREDAFNLLRPLIGYGPESMYVAYSRFYPPELTQVEKRNATPDRSHNETWDSLAITGLLGLLAYLALFGSVFYYGLKWLGLISGERQRNLFLLLYAGVGLLSALGFVLLRGAGYFGVGLPFGMLLGLVLYLVLTALFGGYQAPQTQAERLRSLVMLGLLGAITAHFVEINFGIAIAATRTCFWIFSAALVVMGMGLTGSGEAGGQPAPDREAVKGDALPEAAGAARKKRRAAKGAPRPALKVQPDGLGPALAGGLILTVVLISLGYDFISISQATGSAAVAVWDSLTRLSGTAARSSPGVLLMFAAAWLAGAAILAAESGADKGEDGWLKRLGWMLGVSLALGLIYWLWHAAGLTAIVRFLPATVEDVLVKVSQYEGLLARYYLYLLFVVFGLAICLSYPWWEEERPQGSRSGAIVGPILLVAALALGAFTNLRVVQADIAFKLADPFARGDTWPVAVSIYQRAIGLAPSEDFYYLFLGRAYIEHAKTLGDPAEREALFEQAAVDLERAQAINPLNTDHTANLARLYSTWASNAQDPQVRGERAAIADEYFAQAVSLSPNNARLWDEWALIYLNLYQQPEKAEERLARALELDPYYDWTYALLAEVDLTKGRAETEEAARRQALEKAAAHYQEAARLATSPQSEISYLLALGQLYIQMERQQQAIAAIEEAIGMAPESAERWHYEQLLAQLYGEVGDRSQALSHARLALSLAPEGQQTSVQELISQLERMPE